MQLTLLSRYLYLLLLRSKWKGCVVLGEVLVKPVLLVPAKLRETNLLKERIKEVFLIVSSKVLL